MSDTHANQLNRNVYEAKAAYRAVKSLQKRVTTFTAAGELFETESSECQAQLRAALRHIDHSLAALQEAGKALTLAGAAYAADVKRQMRREVGAEGERPVGEAPPTVQAVPDDKA